MKRILDAVAAAVGAPGRPELIQAVWLWILVAGGVALVTVLARLVGENGSGKSTIATLLCRLYDPARGDIAVDGISLRDIDTMASRREIRVAFQDYAHYAMTARVLARRAHPDSRRAIQLARSARRGRAARGSARSSAGAAPSSSATGCPRCSWPTGLTWWSAGGLWSMGRMPHCSRSAACTPRSITPRPNTIKIGRGAITIGSRRNDDAMEIRWRSAGGRGFSLDGPVDAAFDKLRPGKRQPPSLTLHGSAIVWAFWCRGDSNWLRDEHREASGWARSRRWC